MPESKRNALLRSIPPVDEILAGEPIAGLAADHPRFPWTQLVRQILDEFRVLDSPPKDLASVDRESVGAWVSARAAARMDALRRGGLVRVLNGTGVVLHTNLGRAVLSDAAAAAACEAMKRYVTLEVDRESGARSKRGVVMGELLELVSGAEASMVVNNNAAAVYLVVSSFSPPGRVIVSRGELVEIGGSFRLPEILRHAASEVVEVGTTNRTYADDYAKAAKPGDLILKVHKSNYEIEGFAHEASLEELVAVGASEQCVVAYDLGSGALHDYRGAGLGDDPPVADILATGVDVVTMSGDKLLGGPQAGIVLGNAQAVGKLKQNPLRRALRVDKVTIAAMQEVLRAYLFAADAREQVPVIGQLLASKDAHAARAQALAGALAPAVKNVTIRVEDDDAAVGGGSLSSESIASSAVVIESKSEAEAVDLARRLRRHDPPLFTRIKGSHVRVNLATIQTEEDDDVRAVLMDVLAGSE